MGRQMASQGGLLGEGPRGVGADFFTRAAAIPGYQSLAGGAQANIGAMDRQRYQGQDFSLNNVPLTNSSAWRGKTQFGASLPRTTGNATTRARPKANP